METVLATGRTTLSSVASCVYRIATRFIVEWAPLAANGKPGAWQAAGQAQAVEGNPNAVAVAFANLMADNSLAFRVVVCTRSIEHYFDLFLQVPSNGVHDRLQSQEAIVMLPRRFRVELLRNSLVDFLWGQRGGFVSPNRLVGNPRQIWFSCFCSSWIAPKQLESFNWCMQHFRSRCCQSSVFRACFSGRDFWSAFFPMGVS